MDRTRRKQDNTFLRTLMILLPLLIITIAVFALITVIKQYITLSGSGGIQTENIAAGMDRDEGKLLLLISPDNPLPSDFKTDLVEYDGIEVDRLMLDDLTALMGAASKAQVALRLSGGYVSAEEQHELYMDEVRRLMAREGLSEAMAREEAEKTVPMEDHSERQSGLSVVFSSSLTLDFSESEEYTWLCRNCINYGFILRYPEGKENVTRKASDPTVFRYVGKENAKMMMTFNMTLDEYVHYLESRTA